MIYHQAKPIAIIHLPWKIYDSMGNDLIKWSDKLSQDYHVLIYPNREIETVKVEIHK
jgi:hypothetical protein